jgi:hypothetical protein
VTGSIHVTVSWGGLSGNALSLDGISGYVEIPNSPSLSNIDTAITIEAWVKPQAQYYNTVVSKGSMDYTIEFVNQQPGFLFQNLIMDYTGASDYWGRLLLDQPIPAGEWTHVAITYHVGQGMYVYVNGTLVHSTTASGLINPGSTTLRIGARVDTNYFEPFKGQIDELRIWNIARSATDISNNMRKELSGSQAGLVGYWKFDESAGATTAADASGNGNNGIVHNNATFVKSGAF